MASAASCAGAFVDVSALDFENLGEEGRDFGIVAALIVFVKLRRFGAIEKNSPAVQAERHGKLLERAQHRRIDRLRHRIYGEHSQGTAVDAAACVPPCRSTPPRRKSRSMASIGLQEWPVLPGDA